MRNARPVRRGDIDDRNPVPRLIHRGLPGRRERRRDGGCHRLPDH